MRRTAALLAFAVLAAPASARDSLGVFEDWGAFRDLQVPRCYAIAKADDSRARRSFQPYATVGTWPRRQLRGQVHFRLSRTVATGRPVRLSVNDRRFDLSGGGADAWAQDRRMDAAIVAAMRSGSRMTISAFDRNGRRFTDRYSLAGAATALDAATVGCARL